MDRQSVRHIRAAKDLVQETIEATVIAMAETYQDIARVPYAVLERVGACAAPLHAIERMQQTMLDASYLAVLEMNERAGAVATAVLDRLEQRIPLESSAFSKSRGQVPMNPELNREYPEPGEAQLIEEMVKVAVERMQPHQGRMRRGQHAKATGCVRGVFTIRDDVADDLCYGVFRQSNRSFQAIVRFSNSSETIDPDGTGAARGMAIKLLDVEGTPAIPGSDQRCQDFLTVNFPVFPFATPAEYLKFFDIRAAPLLGDPLAVAWLALFHTRHAQIAAEILVDIAASPLEERYWSGSPYWLGPARSTGGRAVKYSLVPRSEGAAPSSAPDSMPADYLSQALARHLRTREAVFEFRVQPQTDPVAMPVEDVSVEWDEGVSKPIPVATLTIGVQDVDSPEGRALAEECEARTFSPWNALAEHRPMGGINRLRQAVYLASQAKRAAQRVP